MGNLSIQALVDGAVDYFRDNGYTDRSVAERDRILRKVADMHVTASEPRFSQSVICEFLEIYENRFKQGGIERIYYRFVNKTVAYLAEYHATGAMRLGRQFISCVSEYYDKLLADIQDYPGWNRKSSRSIWSVAKTYFYWLMKNGHADLSDVTIDVVRRYLVDCASRLNGGSLDTIRRVIKKLCDYFFEQGLCADNCERLFSFAVPLPRKLQRIIPQNEIALTLNMINRDSAIGKRDYAIILLALVTGLRAIDIVNLKLADIDWRNGEIRIVQSKTGNPLALPLTTDVGEATRAYIESARPECDIANVFIRSRGPLGGMTTAALHGQFNTYRVKAGLPKCAFHGLRRTLGTNMVTSGTPITVVSQTLGHADLNSTRHYVSLDAKHLSECALDLTGIEPKARKKGVAS